MAKATPRSKEHNGTIEIGRKEQLSESCQASHNTGKYPKDEARRGHKSLVSLQVRVLYTAQKYAPLAQLVESTVLTKQGSSVRIAYGVLCDHSS